MNASSDTDDRPNSISPFEPAHGQAVPIAEHVQR